MNAITQLDELLNSLSPELQPEEYVFCSVKGNFTDYEPLKPVATVQESEGLTLVIAKEAAINENLFFECSFKMITLTVHSSLNAVGLTAAVASKLAEKGVSANVIAAYYHDHIFVPVDKASVAMNALAELYEPR